MVFQMSSTTVLSGSRWDNINLICCLSSSLHVYLGHSMSHSRMSQDWSFGAIGSFCNACDGFVVVCHHLVRWLYCTETTGWSYVVLPSRAAWPQQDPTYWRSRDRGKKSQDDGGTMLMLSSKRIIHTQSSYLSQISEIIYICGEKIVMWRNFGKYWEILRNFGRSCSYFHLQRSKQYWHVK